MSIIHSTEIKTDLTESVKDITNQVILPPASEFSNGLTKLLSVVTTAIDNVSYKYIENSKKKKELFLSDLSKKYDEIPKGNLTDPSVNILGLTLESLKYNLDEEYLVKLYTNILISDMDTRTKSKCHVCFIEILKQLSKNDLELLTAIYKMKDTSSIPFGKLKIINSNNKRVQFEIHNAIYLSEINDYIISDYNQFSRSIENLQRLGLISISYNNFFSDKKVYEKLINNVSPTCEHFLKKLSEENENVKLDCEPGILSISNLGYDLMKICLRDI